MSNRLQQVGRGDCAAQCPQGNPCTCSDKAHTLHICEDKMCACHCQERYRSEAQQEVVGGRDDGAAAQRSSVRVVFDSAAPGGVGWVAVARR